MRGPVLTRPPGMLHDSLTDGTYIGSPRAKRREAVAALGVRQVKKRIRALRRAKAELEQTLAQEVSHA